MFLYCKVSFILLGNAFLEYLLSAQLLIFNILMILSFNYSILKVLVYFLIEKKKYCLIIYFLFVWVKVWKYLILFFFFCFFYMFINLSFREIILCEKSYLNFFPFFWTKKTLTFRKDNLSFSIQYLWIHFIEKVYQSCIKSKNVFSINHQFYWKRGKRFYNRLFKTLSTFFFVILLVRIFSLF